MSNKRPKRVQGNLDSFFCKKSKNELKSDNERLVHRIHQVIKQLRRMRVERSFIVARLDKHRDHWREVESQIDVGTEIPSVELDELLSIEVDDLLSMELYNIKNQEIPETPNQEKNSNMKSTEKKDPILPKRPADPFLGCII